MPLAQITSNVPAPSDEACAKLLTEVSLALAQCFGKPERWVMTCLHPPARMTFGGSADATAYVEVKNIGKMSPEKAREVSAAVTHAVTANLEVPADRVYVELADAVDHLWGWNGGTFA